MTGEEQSITFLVKEEMLLRVDLAALVGVVEVESMVSVVREKKSLLKIEQIRPNNIFLFANPSFVGHSRVQKGAQ